VIHTNIIELPLILELPLRRDQKIRAHAIALFRERDPIAPDALKNLSTREWKALLPWLDTSGLALYLLDRLRERNLLAALPPFVLQRLEENLCDNTVRTAMLVGECCAIHHAFVAADVSSALLKGFSLWPHSVPRLELRSQLDLDFLVSAEHERRAQHVLESRGYQLRGVSGRSREFKTPYAGTRTLNDLYKPLPQFTVEVHLEAQETGLLARCEHHTLGKTSIPVLPAADLLLGQALHLSKHLTRDQMRTSHMLELYRHVLARGDDPTFWSRVRELCAGQPNKVSGLGLALDFVAQQMDPACLHSSLRAWTTDTLPLAARLWTRRYGASTATASFPGTKLHLLLQEAMVPLDARIRAVARSGLLPRRLPPPIAVPTADETMTQAIGRQARQARFILFRLRFHVGEGLRYLSERSRWRRLLSSVPALANQSDCTGASRPEDSLPSPQQSHDIHLTQP
jgi:hypothetical protein